MADIVSLYSLITLGAFLLLLRWLAFGYCRACNLHRDPRCGCDPEKKRKPWKNSGK